MARLRVVMRGDVYDGRNFVKSAMGGPSDPKVKARHPDLDLDIKLGVVAGHYGETMRGLDWRMSRRDGRVRTFSLNAKIGRDTPLIGEMRTRINNGKPVLYFETSDAGALFRFTDIYQRMVGGKMWIGMDPPTQDGSAQDGIINVSDFSIRGEGTLDSVVSNAPNASSEQQHRVQPGARRLHPRAGPHDGPRWRAARADDRRHHRRQHRLRARPGRACAARWCRSTASTTCSARSRSSACSSAAAATKACSASPTR